MKLFDNHCHLEELFRKGVLEKELAEARAAGINGWFSSALCSDEYAWHLKQNIEGMIWCAGIHPNYEKSSEEDFGFLVNLCEAGVLSGIGEIGLDSRNPDDDGQKSILLKQLELARDFELPVIFHVVKRYYDLYKLLKDNFPKIRGWLHGFNGSLAIMEAFSNLELGFSLNARLPEPEVVKRIISRGNWQIETDAPYALPKNLKADHNSLKNLVFVKSEIENITGGNLWK
ncbi:MAG: TatD family hydrolase [Candidatus Cloacimonetes bacterium]|nr:TatD family hydrolase [Candidatus Cloacimonadota bacterium]